MAKCLIVIAQPNGGKRLHRARHRPLSGARHGLGVPRALLVAEQGPGVRAQRVTFRAPGGVRGQHRRPATAGARLATQRRPCPAVRIDPPEQGPDATLALEVRAMAIRQVTKEAMPLLR